MAGTTAPLFGLDASGSLGKAIVFSKWRGRTYVRRHSIPSNPQSGLQTGMRAVFKFIAQNFAGLSDAVKLAWEEADASLNITGLNSQMKVAQARARVNQGPYENPTPTPVGTIAAPGSVVVTPQPKGLHIAWTNDAGDPGDYTSFVYLSLDAISGASIGQLVAVVPVAQEEVTIPGLLTGETYNVRIANTDVAGVIGALSTNATGVPT